MNKKDSMKFMFFNRFWVLRYSIAIFFFANFYWMVTAWASKSLSLIIPLVMMFFALAVAIELTSKLHTNKSELPLTKAFYLTQLGLNLLLVITCLTPLYDNVFPFLKNSGQLFVELICAIGAILCLLSLAKIKQLVAGTDRQFKIMKMFEKNN